MTNNYMFFDEQLLGHHWEYIDHIIGYIVFHRLTNDNYYFVVHTDFLNTFPEVEEKISNFTNIKIIHLSKFEVDYCNEGRIKRSFRLYKLANKYARQYQISRIIYLYFNSLMLALFFYRPTYSISGIMVANFHRINKQGLKNRINYLRKKIQTWLITKNGKIQTIFILNDDEAVNYFNQCYRCCLFKMLPDPIPQIKSSNNFDVRTSYNIDINRKIILHIGVLGERKGTLDIITAMKYIPTFLQQNICLCIIGKATEYFNNTLNKLIIDSGIGANVQIVRENSFIDNERMKSYFEQCDCVLIPYKIPELSSGILGHASLAGKPVIGPNKGLLGELIVKNRLGLVFNDLFEFKDKLISVLLGDFIYFKNEKFINSRSPDFFAKMILDSCTTEKI